MKSYFSKHISKSVYQTLMPQTIKPEHYLISALYNSKNNLNRKIDK